MDDIRPSTVLDLVPGAFRAQMGAFLQIAQDLKNKVKGGGRGKRHKAPRKDAFPEADKPISLFVDLKRQNKVKPEEGADLACPTDENSKFMSDLRKLLPQENGGEQKLLVEMRLVNENKF